jgi:hypothetical protein
MSGSIDLMSMLEEWIGQVSAELGIPADAADITLLLDVAGDAAHAVTRTAAPLTTFLIGVAVGRGLPLPEAAARVRALAAARPGEP